MARQSRTDSDPEPLEARVDRRGRDGLTGELGLGAQDAVLHEDDAVCARGVFRVVRDEEHRALRLARDLGQERHDALSGRDVDVAGRLVGEEERRSSNERARDRDELHFAARELRRHVPLARAHPDARDGLRDRGFIGRGAVDEVRKHHVLAGAEGRYQVEELVHDPDLAPS